MRSYILPLILILTLSACTSDSNSISTTNSKSEVEMEKQINQLKRESAQKDSLINQSLAFFNEIEANLESIEIKKDELSLLSANPEITTDNKKWILEQIRHINFLRKENVKKVNQLTKNLKKSGLKVVELNNMVDNLISNIRVRDEQIGILQDELGSLDKAYSKLFDAYQEKAELVIELTDKINTAYYSYGTEEELAKNQVIELKNGFIGIGKKIKLLDEFNEKYFAKIDLTEEKEIFIEGTELKFITDHPSKSYSLARVGRKTKIKISNPSEFWKVSKYLVVIVD